MWIYVECGYSLSNRIMLSANENSKNEKGERICYLFNYINSFHNIWVSIKKVFINL